MNNNLLPAAAALLLASISSSATAQSASLDLREGASSWQTVVDGVMGGRSTGKVTVSNAGVVEFTGTLSLENNGGFSQVRRPVDGSRFADAQGIVLECRGDGRTYSFDLRVSNARMMAGGFRTEFETVDGEWTRILLPFANFELQSFGRRVRNAPALDPSLIESIGVTLGDKKPGPFRLEIRAIETLGVDAPAAAIAGSGSDLVSVAKAAGLTTLLDAVTAAQLELPDTAVTIFAPTNDAFAKLPEGAVAALLRPENRRALTGLLGLHVVRGRIAARELLAGRRLTTLAGAPLEAALEGGRITVGGNAKLIEGDIQASNGVIHLIDTVLVPAPSAATAVGSEIEIVERDVTDAAIAVYEAAINRGAVLFNAGNTAACAAVYEVAIESMILLGGRDLGDAVLQRLLKGRREGQAVTSTRERSWALRRALDEVYFMLARDESGPARVIGAR